MSHILYIQEPVQNESQVGKGAEHSLTSAIQQTLSAQSPTLAIGARTALPYTCWSEIGGLQVCKAEFIRFRCLPCHGATCLSVLRFLFHSIPVTEFWLALQKLQGFCGFIDMLCIAFALRKVM